MPDKISGERYDQTDGPGRHTTGITDEMVQAGAEALERTGVLSGSMWTTGDDTASVVDGAARAVAEALAPLIAAQALRNGEERTDWCVWELAPGGLNVHTLLSNPDDDDEEQWALRRAEEIRTGGGTAEARRRVVTTIVGPWESVGACCARPNMVWEHSRGSKDHFRCKGCGGGMTKARATDV